MPLAVEPGSCSNARMRGSLIFAAAVGALLVGCGGSNPPAQNPPPGYYGQPPQGYQQPPPQGYQQPPPGYQQPAPGYQQPAPAPAPAPAAAPAPAPAATTPPPAATPAPAASGTPTAIPGVVKNANGTCTWTPPSLNGQPTSPMTGPCPPGI